ncbi:choice-of-anchor Q domain-containing protein [Neolewinella antarctica]|uniref:Secretion system C-terminal sorting domain-containing protein n=1 Tax=Neolewinella antarctica TaxID=442734 RepID=A0ABX0XA47_9BACT|nr:choice-of-anchor Q domain-containing protein [Neolewinella antarctica]NJC26123.1 hypothetical protein [Neolewinella antarctica]
MRKIYLIKISLTVLLAFLMLPALFAATITVTSSGDSGAGTFRQAVLDAVSGDAIRFAAATDGVDIVLVTEVTIDKNLSIIGNGMANTVLNGNKATRLINIISGTVQLRGLTLTRGLTTMSGGGLQNLGGTVTLISVTVSSSTASGATATQGGGGIHNAGAMRLTRSMITTNTATGASGSGGGILNSAGGSLRINSTSIVNNEANRAGGGIEDASGTAFTTFVASSTIDDNVVNTSPGNGGGVHVGGSGNFNIGGGTVSGNTAGSEGGGLWNSGGTMSIGKVTINGNAANGAMSDNGGGGIYNDGGIMFVRAGTRVTNNTATVGAGSGGGIFNAGGGDMQVVSTTVTGNTANRAGGGIEDASGTAFTTFVAKSTINDNVVNTSPGNGGGVHVGSGGNFSISGGTVSGNIAGSEGGGLWNSGGTMSISRATIDGNAANGLNADNGGGGLYNDGGTMFVRGGTIITSNEATMGAGSGGGILNAEGGSLRVVGTTVAGNTANRAGGGIEDASGTDFMTFVANSTIDNNVVNTSPGNGGGIHIGSDGSISIVGGSVSGNSAGAEGGGLWNNIGTMNIRGVTVANNISTGADGDQGGGGLFNNGGTMNVASATIENNSATGASGSGGGLLTTDGVVTVRLSTFAGNTANRAGGAVEQIDGSFTSFVTDYTNNVAGPTGTAAPGNGGAFHVTGRDGIVDFTRGNITGNTAAGTGGGLWNQSGVEMTVTEVSIADNSAAGNGGGGIWNNGGSLDIERSLIADNRVTTQGGGVYNTRNGFIFIVASTFTGNSAAGVFDGSGRGAIIMLGSTVALNEVGLNTGPGPSGRTNSQIDYEGCIIGLNGMNIAPGATLIDAGENLVGNTNTGLQPLADNGGPTMTHAIDCTSDAINLYTQGSRRDQRGKTAFGGVRDAGAFELRESCPTVAPLAEADEADDLGESNKEVISVYPNPAPGDQINVILPASFEGTTILRLVDNTGRAFSVREVTAPGTSVAVRTGGLPAGAYTLQALNGRQTQSTRVVVTR